MPGAVAVGAGTCKGGESTTTVSAAPAAARRTLGSEDMNPGGRSFNGRLGFDKPITSVNS